MGSGLQVRRTILIRRRQPGFPTLIGGLPEENNGLSGCSRVGGWDAAEGPRRRNVDTPQLRHSPGAAGQESGRTLLVSSLAGEVHAECVEN